MDRDANHRMTFGHRGALALALLLGASATTSFAQGPALVPPTAGADVIVIIPDSLADAPRTLSELLRERVPSAMVNRPSGALGAPASVSLRDQSVVRGDNPLVVIDGVRQVNYRIYVDTLSRAAPSILDDVMLDDVARIEVLNGPAAAAEYGYDGQRGVIVVTTRTPGAGPPRFRASVTAAAAQDNAGYARNFAAFTAAGARCPYYQQAQGSCTATTTSRFTPILDYSPFRVGHSARAQLGVTGGLGTVGYAAALGGEHGTGTMQADAADGINGSLRLTVPVRRTMRIGLRSFATERGVSMPAEGDLGYVALGVGGEAIDCSSATPCGTDSTTHGYFFGPPSFLAPRGPHRRIGRVGGGLTFDVDPTPTLSLATTLTGDMFRDEAWMRDSIPHPSVDPVYTSNSRFDATERNWRVDAGQAARLIVPLGAATSTTHFSIGMHSERSRDDRSSSTASVILGRTSLAAASSRYALDRERVELSLDERLDLGERGALSAGVMRTSTRAGNARFAALADPHADAFYQLVGPPRPLGILTMLRLRAAVARTNGFDMRMIERRFFTGGQPLPGGSFATRRPDRSTEAEGGLDLGVAPAALRLSVTAFSRRDGIRDIIPFVGAPSHYRRINGGELTIDAIPIELTAAQLQLHGQLGVSHDRVRNDPPDFVFGYFNDVRIDVASGHSWNELHGFGFGWADVNGDGRIEGSEVYTLPSSYLGRSRPSSVGSLGADLRLARTWRLTAVVDHMGGFKVFDMAALLRCAALVCAPLSDPAAPLADQARAVAAVAQTYGAFVVPGDVTTLRDLSVSWISSRPAALVHGSSLRVTFSAHDVASWTQFKGIEPETDVPLPGVQAGTTWYAGQTIPRTFALRVALTY